MADGRILVTGATGNVGGQVVRQLLAAGLAPRALTRGTTGFPEGVEVVRGDHTDPATIRAVAEGVDAVFLMWPSPDTGSAAEVARAIAANASRVVLLSTGAVDDRLAEQTNPIGHFHAVVERAVVESGVRWTFLRAHGFAANTRAWAGQVRAGDEVRGAYGQAAHTLLHEADIAAVAVRALTEDGHDEAKYQLTGPELLTRAEQVRAIGEAIGRPLRWHEVDPDDDRTYAGLLPDDVARQVIGGFAELVDHPVPPTSDVADVTHAPARTFREWLADHLDDFR
ncbi:NAD(P)H-binding protein [Actinosynnema sp. NPDC047251]|uniref:NmrA family protein n=1 Tax=Saccharothrix espanaensis (strain ATCC 51144 / DSM 44229 / JCM 9112 / NBRC 15066 / NRRL 15764) TaxID=1179773 RepID=K0K0S1_SACES|nr:NAD(P)H-binding protein [Saccharothrix espanaensis]CCH31117.1 NmrA family protein [Saccharothrix espanaensis DSM 44229]